MKRLLAFFIVLLAMTGARAAFLMASTGITAFPLVTAGSGWTGPTLPDQATTASINANVGTSGTGNGWGDDAIAAWDNVPYVSMQQSDRVCVLASQVSGIASVLIGVDGGTFVAAAYTTVGPARPSFTLPSYAGEYCVRLNPSSADGQHEFRAIITPNNGIPRVLQSSYTAVVTANNALLTVGPHGQRSFPGGTSVGIKQVVVTNVIAGFTAGTGYFISPGGMKPGAFGLATSQTGTSCTPGVSGCAITCPNGSPPTLNVNGLSYNGGQPLGLAYYGGSVGNWGLCNYTTTAAVTPFNQVYYVCGSAGSPVSPPYSLSDSYADATGACTDLSAAYTGVAVHELFSVYPLVLPTASGTMTVDLWQKGDIENLPFQAEGLFEFTNWNSDAYTTTSYVDATSGSDSTSCGATGSPCATIAQAASNLAFNSTSQSYTQSQDAGTGCLILSRGSNKFTHVGQGVILSGTNFGWNFTAGEGGTYGTLPKGGYYPTPTLQEFFVSTDAFSSGAHFAVATTPLAAQTPGSCLQWNAAHDTGLGAMNVSPDIGGDTIYLRCDSGCATPSQYVFGTASGTGFSYYTNETWLNVLPDPGQSLTPNNVQIIGAGAHGINTFKVHLSASIIAPTISLTLASSVTNGATSFTSTVAPTFTSDGGNWYLTNGGGCFAEGAESSDQYDAAVVTASGTTITLTGTSGASITGTGCPSGTTVVTAHSFSVLPFTAAGYNLGSIWLDGGSTGENVTGAAIDTGVFSVAAGTQYYGQYLTNLSISNYQGGASYGIFVRNVYEDYIGQGGYVRVDDLIASSSDNNGASAAETATFLSCSANCSGTSGTVLSLSALPTYLKVGYVLDIGGSTSCHGLNTWITNYTVSPATITVSGASGNWGGTGCANGASIAIGTGQHQDWDDLDGDGDDLITVNSYMPNTNSALAYFQQGGSYWDMAVLNTPLHQAPGSVSALPVVDLQANVQNLLIQNSILDGRIALVVATSYLANDVYFVSDTMTTLDNLSLPGGVSRGETYFYNDSCPGNANWITNLGYTGIGVNNSYFGAPVSAGNC